MSISNATNIIASIFSVVIEKAPNGIAEMRIVARNEADKFIAKINYKNQREMPPIAPIGPIPQAIYYDIVNEINTIKLAGLPLPPIAGLTIALSIAISIASEYNVNVNLIREIPSIIHNSIRYIILAAIKAAIVAAAEAVTLVMESLPPTANIDRVIASLNSSSTKTSATAAATKVVAEAVWNRAWNRVIAETNVGRPFDNIIIPYIQAPGLLQTVAKFKRIYAIDDTLIDPPDEENQFKLFSNSEDITFNCILYGNPNIPVNILINETNFIYTDKKHNLGGIKNLSADKEIISFIKTLLIKCAYDGLIVDPNNMTSTPEIEALLREYNVGSINKEEILVNNITSISNELLDELLKYYKINYGKLIIKDIITNNKNIDNINNKFINLNAIDIKKLINIDYSKKRKTLFINESNLDKYYNYDYTSINETSLCYKNNKDIIINLLNSQSINHKIRDQEGNTILHYLVNIENLKLFKNIFQSNPKNQQRFCDLLELKNNHNQTPIDIINQKILENNKNFYSITKGTLVDQTKLLHSSLYSAELMIKLRNNNELKKNVPKHIENIFDDIYFIFNLKSSLLYNQNIKYVMDTYDKIYTNYNKFKSKKNIF